jgi:hypothetical protein
MWFINEELLLRFAELVLPHEVIIGSEVQKLQTLDTIESVLICVEKAGPSNSRQIDKFLIYSVLLV